MGLIKAWLLRNDYRKKWVYKTKAFKDAIVYDAMLGIVWVRVGGTKIKSVYSHIVEDATRLF